MNPELNRHVSGVSDDESVVPASDFAVAPALALDHAVALTGAAKRGPISGPARRDPEQSEGGVRQGEPHGMRRRASVASRDPSAPSARGMRVGDEVPPSERSERQTRPTAQAKPERASPNESEWVGRVCRSQSDGRQAPTACATGGASGGTGARGGCGSSPHGRPTGRPSWLSKLGPCGTRRAGVRMIRQTCVSQPWHDPVARREAMAPRAFNTVTLQIVKEK